MTRTLIILFFLLLISCFLPNRLQAFNEEFITAPLDVPRLRLPEDGVQTTEIVGEQKLTFSWTGISTAAFYQFQLCTDVDCDSPVIDVRDCKENRYVVRSFTKNTVYYWRVRSISADGKEGAWSKKFKFVFGYPDKTKK